MKISVLQPRYIYAFQEVPDSCNVHPTDLDFSSALIKEAFP